MVLSTHPPRSAGRPHRLVAAETVVRLRRGLRGDARPDTVEGLPDEAKGVDYVVVNARRETQQLGLEVRGNGRRACHA